MRAGFAAVVSIVVLALAVKRNVRSVVTELGDAIISSPKQMCAVAAAVLNAGIIVGVLQMTGLGLRMSSLIIDLAGGSLIVALLLSMVMAILLGMGMPTSGAYIIMGTLLAPGLVRLGLSTIQAHMFVFYFACMSMITPPVAVAAYAAAGIAEASPSKVGFAAWKLALAAFVVPFMFAYSPELLAVGEPIRVVIALMTACIGSVFLACALEGRVFLDANPLERVLMGIAAVLLIMYGALTDVIGISIGAVVAALQFIKTRQSGKTEITQA